jgi:hypothetical protein
MQASLLFLFPLSNVPLFYEQAIQRFPRIPNANEVNINKLLLLSLRN